MDNYITLCRFDNDSGNKKMWSIEVFLRTTAEICVNKNNRLILSNIVYKLFKKTIFVKHLNNVRFFCGKKVTFPKFFVILFVKII